MRQAMTRSRHRFEPASAAICVTAVRSAVGTRVGMQPLYALSKGLPTSWRAAINRSARGLPSVCSQTQ